VRGIDGTHPPSAQRATSDPSRYHPTTARQTSLARHTAGVLPSIDATASIVATSTRTRCRSLRLTGISASAAIAGTVAVQVRKHSAVAGILPRSVVTPCRPST
jgi:hypothetical protein